MQQSNTQQSNTLRRLEIILDEAVTNGNINQNAGPILLEVMQLSKQAENVVDFYEILNKAKEEAIKLNNIPKIDRYLKTIEELNQFFIINHVWNTKWDVFANHIKNRNVLNTLDALANYYHQQSPAILLDQDRLAELNDKFQSILDEIIDSDLSKDLKKFLTERVEEILRAIRRYNIDGTEGLKKAAQSLVSDLVITEHSFKNEDKNNSIYTKVKAWGLALLLFIGTPSAYDIIGAVPDIQDYWMPKLEELAVKVEQSICETQTFQEAVEKVSKKFDRHPKKSITGSRDLKALPASRTNPEATTDDKSDP